MLNFTDPSLTRCDRCSAAGMVVLNRGAASRELVLCGHHYRDHEITLTAANWRVTVDDREAVTV